MSSSREHRVTGKPDAGRSDATRRFKAIVLTGLAASALALVIWWPLGFSTHAIATFAERTVGLGIPWFPEPRDAVVNFGIFVLFGWLASSVAGVRVGRVGAVALTLSVIIELGQILQPGRIVSVIDVAMNTGGAVFGAVFVSHTPRLVRRLSRAGTRAIWLAVPSMTLSVILFGYLQSGFARLDTWSPDYHLMIGNEATGDRPWCGEASALLMRVGGRVWTQESFSFVKRTHHARPHGLACQPDIWLQSTSPPVELIDAVRSSGRFQVALVARSARPNQQGPARIVSISRDPLERNITIGQDGKDLIVRIRRRWGGSNGTRPFYRLRDVFAGQPVDIRVAVGADSTAITVGPKTILDRHDISKHWWMLLPRDVTWRTGPWEIATTFVWWLFLFGPSGLLIGAATAGKQTRLRAWMICLGAAVAAWGVMRAVKVPVSLESLLLIFAALLVGFYYSARVVDRARSVGVRGMRQ